MLIKRLFGTLVIILGLSFQQLAFAKYEYCPYKADTCKEIEDLIDNIKENTSSQQSSTGINIVEAKDCCIKTLDANGDEKTHFDVDEWVYFGMQDGTADQWGFSGFPGSPPSSLDYTIGFSTEGTYLDESCHAKLHFINYPPNPSYVRWRWIDQDTVCDNYQEYSNGLLYYGGAYTYTTPGIKVITSIALPFYFFNTKIDVPMTFKVITVGDEYRPENYSWLVPVLSILLQ